MNLSKSVSQNYWLLFCFAFCGALFLSTSDFARLENANAEYYACYASPSPSPSPSEDCDEDGYNAFEEDAIGSNDCDASDPGGGVSSMHDLLNSIEADIESLDSDTYQERQAAYERIINGIVDRLKDHRCCTCVDYEFEEYKRVLETARDKAVSPEQRMRIQGILESINYWKSEYSITVLPLDDFGTQSSPSGAVPGPAPSDSNLIGD